LGSGIGLRGYFCHTPLDVCVNSADCDGWECLPEEGCGGMTCGYSTLERWECFRYGTR
jgi:hypothetical protein